MEKKLHVVLLKYTPDPEETVSQAAKLCYSASEMEDLIEKIKAKDQKEFIRKLAMIGHLSPFEHVSFTFGIEGISRACTHQLVRHRLASFSQQSQRYVGETSGKKNDGIFDYIVPPSMKALGRKEVVKWKSDMQKIQEMYDYWVDALESTGVKGEKVYEDARFILPNAAETKIVVTMNARQLLHFFEKRCCNRAQWEIREMATQMLKLVFKKAPNIFANSGPSCAQLGGRCSEGSMSCGEAKEVKEKFDKLKNKK